MSNITKKAFPVLNMHCAGCANNVEKTVKKLAGVVDASVNFATNTLSVSYEADKLTPGEIRAAVLAGGTGETLPAAEAAGYRCMDLRCSHVAVFYGSDACTFL